MSQPDSREMIPAESALAPRAGGALAEPGDFESFEGPGAGPGPAVRKRLAFSLWRVLRYKWTMLVVFALVAAGGLWGIWRFAEPTYRAVAVIEVQPSRPRIAFNPEDFGGLSYYQQFLGTQVRKLTSAAVVERVMARRDVQATSVFAGGGLALPYPLSEVIKPKSPGRRVLEALEIKADGTTLINVAITLPDPDASATIANAFVEEYLKSTREAEESAEQNLLAQRRKQMDSLKVQLEEEQRQADAYRKMLQISSPDELLDQQRLNLNELVTRRDRLQLELSTARRMLARVEQLEAEAQARGGESAAAIKYSDDPDWRQMSGALASVEFEIETSRYGPAHPEMIRLQKQADFLRERLAQRQLELDAQPRLPQLAQGEGLDAQGRVSPDGLRYQIQQLETHLEVLNPLIAEKTKQFKEHFDMAGALTVALRRIEDLRDQYRAVKTLVEQQEIERFAPAFIRWDTVARRPYAIYEDPRKKLSLGALFAALVAACGAGLARAYFSGALFEIERVDELPSDECGPLLGPMPIVNRTKPAGPEFALQSECIRMVRTALLQRLEGPGGHVVQVTSAGPGAGKTTFVVMLARSLAQINKRVLLVDADLRNPSVARELKLDEVDQDFVKALSESDRETRVLRRARATTTPGLHLLIMGRPVEAQEAEVLATDAPQICFDQWRRQYDVILLDSSPLLPVADARMLARHADGTIFVVREDHCHRKDIFDALAYLRAAGGTLLGSVFNGATRSVSYHGAYHYTRAYAGAGQNPMDIRVVDAE